MSRPSLKIVTNTSPEREALAAAISDAAPLRAAADMSRAKAEAARGALASAVEAVPAAERAVAEAKARLIENPAADRAELRALRQAEVDAADDVAIAREVSRRADASEADAARATRYAVERVETAADAVLVASFKPAIEAAEHAGREFARLACVAAIIGEAGSPWNGERARLTSRVETLNVSGAFRGDMGALRAVREQAQAPWRAARVALLMDPAAPVPEVS